MQAPIQQPRGYFDAHFIEVVTENGTNYLVFEYQGQTIRQATFSDPNFTRYVQLQGQYGVVERADHCGGIVRETQPMPTYRFSPYTDQSLRRAYELDITEQPRIDINWVGNYNPERIGWRNATHPDGFLAPAGIIPGKEGRFIPDESEALMIDIPREFEQLCREYGTTPEEVLRGFIADAAGLQNYVDEPRGDGYDSNGSDERMMAEHYFERAYSIHREFKDVDFTNMPPIA